MVWMPLLPTRQARQVNQINAIQHLRIMLYRDAKHCGFGEIMGELWSGLKSHVSGAEITEMGFNAERRKTARSAPAKKHANVINDKRIKTCLQRYENNHAADCSFYKL